MDRSFDLKLVPDGPYRFRIPKAGPMRAEGLIYATREMIDALGEDQAPRQVANVACLPGIVGRSIAMPDFHWGYGFPIGGVAAFDPDRGGVVSPGGVGYDINCGVRLLATGLAIDDARARIEMLADALHAAIPSGVGSKRNDLRLSEDDLEAVMTLGARWAVERGLGVHDDLLRLEEGGRIDGADPDDVGEKPRERGRAQIGTLGSGNHFCEVGYVDEVYDADVARAFGLRAGGVTVFVHTGSRGFGHQVCDDHLKEMLDAGRRHGIEIPDKQLCCAPLGLPEALRYVSAMAAAANFAFANRQAIAHCVRDAMEATFGAEEAAAVRVVYDVCHNIGKWEEHPPETISGGHPPDMRGARRRVFVHRKGATRALPPGDARLPEAYRAVGQPVLVPGDMGRYSFVLVGTDAGAREAFASCCHGAGRVMSRKAATKAARGRDVVRELAAQGVIVRAASRETVVEEMPEAYKDVGAVVDVVEGAGLARRVARIRPVAVVKG